MFVGWDSKTDSFFISGLTDLEAGVLQGSLVSLLENVRNKKMLFSGTEQKSPAECEKLIFEIQNALWKAKQLKEAGIEG